MKVRRVQFLSSLVAISLALSLSGCSSDAFKNAGECSELGKSRIENGQVQVCIGLENSLKWYLEGKYFEDFLLLGKLVYRSNKNWKIYEESVSGTELEKYYWQSEKLAPSAEDVIAYSEGNPRWDQLIEAMLKLEDENAVQDELLNQRQKAEFEYSYKNGSRQAVIDAQQNQVDHLNGDYSTALIESGKKRSVLEAELAYKYRVKDRTDAVIFALNLIKSREG